MKLSSTVVFFRILYTSGMRVSELRLARLKDVNLNENISVSFMEKTTGKRGRMRYDNGIKIHKKFVA